MRKYIVFGILAVMLIGFCLAETPEEATRRYRQWQKEDIHNERRFEHRDYRRSRFEEMQERRRLEKEREEQENKGQKGQKKTALQTTRSQLKMLEEQVSELQELILMLEQRVAILEGSDPNIYAEPESEPKKPIKENVNKDEQAKRIEKFGEPPQNSAWDGSVKCVKDYLKAIAKDPDSLKYESWSEPYYSEEGWIVRCNYRAKNSFGGYEREIKYFLIRHGAVVEILQ